jgi:hypothetical protein
MFKIIGAAVVYGFATFGLVTWLMKTYKKEPKEVNASPN